MPNDTWRSASVPFRIKVLGGLLDIWQPLECQKVPWNHCSYGKIFIWSKSVLLEKSREVTFWLFKNFHLLHNRTKSVIMYIIMSVHKLLMMICCFEIYANCVWSCLILIESTDFHIETDKGSGIYFLICTAQIVVVWNSNDNKKSSEEI